MRTVYAIQFEVRPATASAQGCQELVTRLAGLTKDWIQGKYRDTYRAPCQQAWDGRPINPCDRHELVGTDESCGEMRLCGIEWQHPDDEDRTVLWNTSCTIASDGQAVQVAFVLRISSASFVVKPASFKLGRPRVLAKILTDFPCSLDGVPIPTKHTVVTQQDIARLVAGTLMNTSRVLPVIVVSPDSWTDRLHVAPGKLQGQLLGFAEIVALKDKWAAFRLTDEVGRELSCYNGAVRLYWPGLRRDSDWRDHPLYFPDRLAEMERETGGLGVNLFRFLASVASIRHAEGNVVRKVRHALDAQRAAHVEAMRQQLQQETHEPEGLREFFEEFQPTLDENDRLRKELETAQMRALELEKEVQDAKANLANVFQYREQAQAQAVQRERDAEPETVLEALTRIRDRYPDLLVVYDSAVESAEESDFGRPAQVLEALLAIAEVGAAWRKARKAKKNFKPLKSAFAEKISCKYAVRESQQTMNMYGGERVFRHQGASRTMEEHLTLGGGDRVNCLQIYFQFDVDSKKVHIGYCGVHLSYSGM
jgi:hypothetical protein